MISQPTLKTVQNAFFFFLSFCLVGWALLVDYRPYLAGFMLGSVVSMINARHLAWKIGRATEQLAEAAEYTQGELWVF